MSLPCRLDVLTEHLFLHQNATSLSCILSVGKQVQRETFLQRSPSFELSAQAHVLTQISLLSTVLIVRSHGFQEP
ncbi:MAG: hypothetical protein A3H27_19195 [Acidobacteria bacterium RIFCSPLOWO2_02_FULL_59_13]|nr:MAG: hypothetical protein A3H27_19195 [Acidobacteria bacterium RIFCSPLOWO2_02_FULL_59_13]